MACPQRRSKAVILNTQLADDLVSCPLNNLGFVPQLAATARRVALKMGPPAVSRLRDLLCIDSDMRPPHVRQLPTRVNLSGRGTLTGRARCLSDVACGLTAICCCARRSWIPACREGVLEANGVFSRLIEEGSGLREQSGGCRTRTRSLPSLVRQPPATGPLTGARIDFSLS